MLKNLIVEIPGGADPEKEKPHTFRFALLIIGNEIVQARDCWKVAFIAGDQTPDDSKKRFEILVDKEEGWPRKLTVVKAESAARIKSVGDAALIIDSTERIPFDFLPFTATKDYSDGAALVKFQSSTVGKEIVREMTYHVDGKEKLRIRQRWVEGEDWWRYYDRHVDGVLVLRARRADTTPLQDAFAKIEPVLLAKEKYHLREDKRLYALVQIEPHQPSVRHVLERLKAATGLEMDLSSELAHHVPDLGRVSPHPKGYFAWQMMEFLATVEIDNAKWEQTKSGYRLTGVTRSPPGRDLETTGDPAPPIPTGRLDPWLVPVGIGLAVLFVALTTALILRQRAARRPKNAAPAS